MKKINSFLITLLSLIILSCNSNIMSVQTPVYFSKNTLAQDTIIIYLVDDEQEFPVLLTSGINENNNIRKIAFKKQILPIELDTTIKLENNHTYFYLEEINETDNPIRQLDTLIFIISR